MARSVFLFERRFVDPILSGTKTGTIRERRKRPLKPGDWMIMRCWQGKPYRSTQVSITEDREVLSVSAVELDFAAMIFRVDELTVFRAELPAFARADGFKSLVDFRHYWVHRRGVRYFRGELIRWR